MILVVFLMIPWLLKLVFWAIHSWSGTEINFSSNDDVALFVLVLGLPAYLSIASHKVYRAKWWITIAKSVILFVGLYFCVVLYRFTLFHATMALL